MPDETVTMDLESLLACMGDDAATLRRANDGDEIADTLELAAELLEAAAKGAARYRWLAARLLAADFDYNGEGVQALVFEMPAGCTVSADCDATIDAAMAAAPAVGAA